MKAKHIFIQPETDAALSKLGGANRAENLRRAVALAEVAYRLAVELEAALWQIEEPTGEYDTQSAEVAIKRYKEAKQ